MNNRQGRLKALGILCFLLLFASPAFDQQPTIRVKAIEIQGQRRVEESTIRFYIGTRVGDPFSVSRLRDDIKKIYDLGFFRDVKVDVDPFEGGLRVVFIVEEEPTVAAVRITGNIEVEDEDLREKTTVAVQSILNPDTLTETVQNMRSLYQQEGYYFVRIESIVEETTANQVNVEFRIAEGQKVSIVDIEFEGNQAFSDKKLRRQIQTKERWFLSFFTETDIYREDQILTDALRVQAFYQDKGYLRVQVGETRIEEDRDKNELRLVVPIQEGAQYSVGSLRAEGDDIFAAEQIRSRLTLEEGEIYVRSSLQQDIVNLTEAYAQRGHPFADIIPTTEVDDEALEVHIVITPRKGRRVFVGQVVIRGNDFTRDRIVRRQVRLEEGALYDGQQLQNTRRRINNLGFFEEVKIETKRGASEDLLDIDVELKEKPTGAVSGGLGFSSRAKLIVFGEIRETNLFGRGQALALRLSASAIDTTGTLSFTEPNFFDTNFSFFATAFAQSEQFDSFDRDRLGGGAGFGRSFGENVFGRLLYQLEFNDIFNLQDNVILDVEDQEGQVTTSSIFPSLVRDTTDNRFRPTRGAISSVRGQVAGKAYGSDDNFYSIFLEYRQFFPLLPKRVIFMGRGQVGYSDGFGGDELPVFERLFLGGSRTVRGFDFREVGPKDAEDRPVGGNASLLFNFELQFPFAAGFRAVTFFDMGQIYDKSGIYDLGELREAAGVGIRVLTPLGPVSLDWGYKLDRQSGEDASELHFAIGRQF